MLLLDAGDSLLLDRDPAKRTLGASSIEAMNLLGYDAMALGMLDISALELTTLAQRMNEASFPLLSANAKRISNGQLLAQPYTIIEMADHRIGILGITEAGSTNDVIAEEPLAAVRAWLPQVRQEADIVILLSHAGLDLDQVIAQQVPGIDIIVSGRTRTTAEPLIEGRSGTVIIHAESARPGYAGEKIGVAHLTFNENGDLAQHQWERIALDDSIWEDEKTTEWVEQALMPSQ